MSKRILVITFFALLWLPLLVGLFAHDVAESGTEQRSLARFPSLTRDPRSWIEFPERASRYSDDHVGFRLAAIRLHNLFKIKVFKTSPSPLLVLGREGWLFLGDPHAVAQYRGVARFGQRELERWARILEERRAWLHQRGIAFVFVLVPNKHSVYGEYMPAYLNRVRDESQLDQLVTYLRQRSSVDVLDLRKALADLKRRQRVYHRTDSHWNGPGAHLAYREILRRLNETPNSPSASGGFSGFTGFEATPTRLVRSESPGLGLAQIVGLAPYYREDRLDRVLLASRAEIEPEYRKDYARRVKEQRPFAWGVEARGRNGARRPRAVMFRDSFANALVPYLSENFERILYVWSRDVEPHWIDVEKPDVVIHQMTERFLGTAPRSIQELRRARTR